MNLFDLRSQDQKPFDNQSNEGNLLPRRSYSQTQLFFVLRLMHLLDVRRREAETIEEWQLKLLDRAIYSTFVDCLEQEVGDDARELLHQQEAAKQG
ncbi:MAG: hypothetical protein HYX94_02365 [Chloroflexi bacterium]|nr:hypothetical protein [Chloroflexota bacterium]